MLSLASFVSSGLSGKVGRGNRLQEIEEKDRGLIDSVYGDHCTRAVETIMTLRLQGSVRELRLLLTDAKTVTIHPAANRIRAFTGGLGRLPGLLV